MIQSRQCRREPAAILRAFKVIRILAVSRYQANIKNSTSNGSLFKGPYHQSSAGVKFRVVRVRMMYMNSGRRRLSGIFLGPVPFPPLAPAGFIGPVLNLRAIMRIAQVAPLFESVPPKLYGGTERVVSYLTEEWFGWAHEVTLFATGDSQTRAKLVAALPTRPVARPGLQRDASPSCPAHGVGFQRCFPLRPHPLPL